jgi:acyl carrier protein
MSTEYLAGPPATGGLGEPPPGPDDLTAVVAGLVSRASAGAISPDEARQHEAQLADLGLSSLSYLKLVDLLEREFDVFIDFEQDLSFLDTVAGIVEFVRARRVA